MTSLAVTSVLSRRLKCTIVITHPLSFCLSVVVQFYIFNFSKTQHTLTSLCFSDRSKNNDPLSDLWSAESFWMFPLQPLNGKIENVSSDIRSEKVEKIMTGLGKMVSTCRAYASPEKRRRLSTVPTFSHFSYFFVLILLFPTFSSNPPTIPTFS